MPGKFCGFFYGDHWRKYKRKKPSGDTGRLIYIDSFVADLLFKLNMLTYETAFSHLQAAI